VKIETLTGDAARALGPDLLALSQAVFNEFSGGYLMDRLPLIDGPAASIARDPTTKQLLGFKLGYRRGAGMFYSWLGGVHPDARRQGIAQKLMLEQHGWAARQGYKNIETRTRASNAAMIVLNLKAGFTIAGYENDRSGIGVVTQRKALAD
jgi:GNAT superfamily N-acetyltransferase